MIQAMNDRFDSSCNSCQAIQGRVSLTIAPRILETEHWIVEHLHPTAIKGWLVVVLNRHCSALHQLTSEEFEEFIRLLQLLCQALYDVLKTEKEYVIQLAEGEGFNHVHFHVIARLPEWPESLRGRRVFSGAGEQIENPLPGEVLIPLALEIREYLLKRWT